MSGVVAKRRPAESQSGRLHPPPCSIGPRDPRRRSAQRYPRKRRSRLVLVVTFGGISMPGVVSLAQDRINLCQPLADGRPGPLCCLNDCYLDLYLLAVNDAEIFVEFDG